MSRGLRTLQWGRSARGTPFEGGSVVGPASVSVVIGVGFHDFQFEMDFLATHQGVEVLLPEFSQEAKTRIALIQVD